MLLFWTGTVYASHDSPDVDVPLVTQEHRVPEFVKVQRHTPASTPLNLFIRALRWYGRTSTGSNTPQTLLIRSPHVPINVYVKQGP